MTAEAGFGHKLRLANVLAAGVSLLPAGYFSVVVVSSDLGLAEPFYAAAAGLLGCFAVVAILGWLVSVRTRVASPVTSDIAVTVGLVAGLCPAALVGAFWIIQKVG